MILNQEKTSFSLSYCLYDIHIQISKYVGHSLVLVRIGFKFKTGNFTPYPRLNPLKNSQYAHKIPTIKQNRSVYSMLTLNLIVLTVKNSLKTNHFMTINTHKTEACKPKLSFAIKIKAKPKLKPDQRW